jgi:hypothetical protein
MLRRLAVVSAAVMLAATVVGGGTAEMPDG